MKVSVILPTYNEAKNIISLIKKIQKTTRKNKKLEIVVVDDNSPDRTYFIVKNYYSKRKSVRCLLRTKNRGLANSIRDGINHASGEAVIVMDSDSTHDPKEIPKMLHCLEKYDLISGSIVS